MHIKMNGESEDQGSLFLAPGPVQEDMVMKQINFEKDDWDDTELIKAYDEAVGRAKHQVMKKLQVNLGLTESDLQEAFSDVSITDKKKKKRKKNKAPEPSSDVSITKEDLKKPRKNKADKSSSDDSITKENLKKPKAKENLKKPKRNEAADFFQWKVADACRAVYHEDGQEYEAEIISIINDQRCIIEFLGYNNEQEELFENLMPSFGKNIIKHQLEDAKVYNDALHSEESVMGSESGRSSSSGYVKMKASKFKAHTDGNFNNEDSFQRLPLFDDLNNPLFNQDHPPFPPVPPMPPFDFPTFNHEGQPRDSTFPNMFPTANNSSARSAMGEDFNSMLFNWYMCGYHTGYFHRGMTNN